MTVRAILVVSLALGLLSAAVAKGPAYTDPKKTDADFAVQGEYVGTLKTEGGELQMGLQVIALGKGQFRCVALHGGLPGAGWDGSEKVTAEGGREGDVVVLKTDQGSARLADGKAEICDADGTTLGHLKRVERTSPTLAAKPPQGAVVLFDGSSADGWKNGKMSDDGLLMQGTTSEATFGSHKLHIEFRLPYQPEDRGQARGNSGIYVQGRYEVQMLDSFGLAGKHNECGGIYSVKDPDVNMCLPPLSWQTYDIDFTAARYDDAGKLLTNPRVTVRHNGVVIHDDVELPGERNTTAAPVKPGPQAGPVYLQNHGNPVRYRNIWVQKTTP